MRDIVSSDGAGAWMTSATLESWAHIASVDDFTTCDPAQYIRVFPRLLPRSGAFPHVLARHMTRCLAALAWRCMTNGDDGPALALWADPTLSATDIGRLGAREADLWFPAGDCPAYATPGAPPAGRTVEEGDAFVLVDALRREIDRGALRPFDLDDAALFTFTTGIHAAYLWPEALPLHEVFTATGWLGHLWRRRKAAMPADLALYFDDIIRVGPDGAPWVRDPHLAKFLPMPGILDELRRAVLARLDGAVAIAVWPGVPPWPAAAWEPSHAATLHTSRPS